MLVQKERNIAHILHQLRVFYLDMHTTSVITESRITTDLERIFIVIYNHTNPTLFSNMSYSQGSVPNFCSHKVVPDSLHILKTKSVLLTQWGLLSPKQLTQRDQKLVEGDSHSVYISKMEIIIPMIFLAMKIDSSLPYLEKTTARMIKNTRLTKTICITFRATAIRT